MGEFNYKEYLKNNPLTKSDKESLNESAPGFANRKFGEPLPTLDSVQEEYEASQAEEESEEESGEESGEKEVEVTINMDEELDVGKGVKDGKYYYIRDKKKNDVLHRGPLTAASAKKELEHYSHYSGIDAQADEYSPTLHLPGHTKGDREQNTKYPDSPNPRDLFEDIGHLDGHEVDYSTIKLFSDIDQSWSSVEHMEADLFDWFQASVNSVGTDVGEEILNAIDRVRNKIDQSLDTTDY